MLNLQRRKLIKSTFTLGISSLLFNSFQTSALTNKSLALSKKVHLLELVYDDWLKLEKCQPSEYLQYRGASLPLSGSVIKRLSVDDFKRGDTKMVAGIMLSKIEVAALAYSGEISTL